VAFIDLPDCLNFGGLEAAIAGNKGKAKVEGSCSDDASGMSGTRSRGMPFNALAMLLSSGTTMNAGLSRLSSPTNFSKASAAMRPRSTKYSTSTRETAEMYVGAPLEAAPSISE